MNCYESIAYYLPHKAPMILLDRVDRIDRSSVICNAEISDSGVLAPFLTDKKKLPSWYLMELMAQTIGVWSGYHRASLGNKPQLAFLLGTRELTVKYPEIEYGVSLSIHAELMLRDDWIGNFNCQVLILEEIIAEARLTVYEPSREAVEKMF